MRKSVALSIALICALLAPAFAMAAPDLSLETKSDFCPGTDLAVNECLCGTTDGYVNDFSCGTYTHSGNDLVYHLVGVAIGQVLILKAEADYDADWAISTVCDGTTGDVLCEDYTLEHVPPSCTTIADVNWFGYATHEWTATQEEYWIWVDSYNVDDPGAYCLEVIGLGFAGEDCSNPAPLGCGDALNSDLTGKVNDYDDADYGCASGGLYDGGDEVWALNTGTASGVTIQLDDSATPAIDLFVTAECPGGSCIGWHDNQVSFVPTGDVIYVFVDCPAGAEAAYGLTVICESAEVDHFDSPGPDAMGMAYYTEDCTMSAVWIASQLDNPGTDNLHLVDAASYAVLRSFDVATLNGWPTAGLVGITMNQDDNIVCTDFNGDIDNYDDTILMYDPMTGAMLGYVETDGPGNDSADGTIIDMVLGIEHIAGTMDEYIVSDNTGVNFTHIAVTWGFPGTWVTAGTHENTNAAMGIDYDACNDVYWLAASWTSARISYNTFVPGAGFTELGARTAEVCPGNGAFFLTWIEDQWTDPGRLWGNNTFTCPGDTANDRISVFDFGIAQGDCPCGVATPTPGGPTYTPRPTNTPRPTGTPTLTPAPTSTPSANDYCPGDEIAVGDCICASTVGFTNLHDCGTGHAGPDMVYHLTNVDIGARLKLIGESADEYDSDWTIATACDGETGDILCADREGDNEHPSCTTIGEVDYFGYATYEWTAAQTEYWIWVDGYYDYSEGDFCFEVLLMGSAGDNCTMPFPLPCEITTPGDLTGKTNDYDDGDYGCASGGTYDGADEVWEMYLLGVGSVTVTLDDSANAGMDLFVTDTCPTGVCLGWNDNEVTFIPTTEVAYIFVDCPAGDEAAYTITATCEIAPGDNCPGIPLAVGDCVCGTTEGFTNQHDCGFGHAGVDVVYHLTGAQYGQTLKFVGEAVHDADWTIATVCDALTGDILCADREGDAEHPSCTTIAAVHDWGYATFEWMATQEEYWIWIDGYGATHSGEYCFEVIGLGFSGEDCTNPFPLACDDVVNGDLTGKLNDYDDSDYGCASGGTYDGGEEVWMLETSGQRAVTIQLDDTANPAMDLFVTDACPTGACLQWDNLQVEIVGPPAVMYVFVDCPAGAEAAYGLTVTCESTHVGEFPAPTENTMGMTYYNEGCAMSAVWVASQEDAPGTDNLYLIDANTHATLRSFDTGTLNAWPSAGLVGITLNQDENVVCTDYNGDLDAYDDTIMMFNPLTGIMLGYVETDGDSNDSTDGSAIDAVLGIEHVAGTTDEYIVSDNVSNVFAHIAVTWGMPGTWETLFTYDNLDYAWAIDYDACHGWYWFSGDIFSYNALTAGTGFTELGTVSGEVCPGGAPNFVTWIEEPAGDGLIWGNNCFDCTVIAAFDFGIGQGDNCPCSGPPHDGDVDNDDRITPNDSYWALLIYLGIPPDGADAIAADYCPRPNGDGVVDPGDAYGILRAYLGYPDPCEATKK